MFKHYDDIEAFDELYREHIQECKRNKDAYQKTEQQFKRRFGKRRYTSFYSFLAAYYRRHNVQKN